MAGDVQLKWEVQLDQAQAGFERVTARTGDLEKALQSLVNASQKMVDKLEEVGKKEQEGKEHTSGLGKVVEELGHKFAWVIDPIAVVERGLEAFKSLIESVNQRAEEGAEKMKEYGEALKGVALGLPGAMPQAEALTQRISTEGNISKAEAAKLLQEGVKGGLPEADIATFGRMAHELGAAPTIATMQAYRQWGLIFGGQRGTPEQFVSQMLVARPGMAPAETAGLAMARAQSLAALGASPEETLAIGAQIGEIPAIQRGLGSVAQALGEGWEEPEIDPRTGRQRRARDPLTGRMEFVKRRVDLQGTGLLGRLDELRTQHPERYAKMMEQRGFRDVVTAIENRRGAIEGGIAGEREAAATLGPWQAVERAFETTPAIRRGEAIEAAGLAATRAGEREAAVAQVAELAKNRAYALTREAGGSDFGWEMNQVLSYLSHWSVQGRLEEYQTRLKDLAYPISRTPESLATAPKALEALKEIADLLRSIDTKTNAAPEKREPRSDDHEGAWRGQMQPAGLRGGG